MLWNITRDLLARTENLKRMATFIFFFPQGAQQLLARKSTKPPQKGNGSYFFPSPPPLGTTLHRPASDTALGSPPGLPLPHPHPHPRALRARAGPRANLGGELRPAEPGTDLTRAELSRTEPSPPRRLRARPRYLRVSRRGRAGGGSGGGAAAGGGSALRAAVTPRSGLRLGRAERGSALTGGGAQPPGPAAHLTRALRRRRG